MVLQNKLGIANSAELVQAEEKISKKKAAELFDSGYLDSLQVGTYAALAAIHQYLLGKFMSLQANCGT